MSHSLKRSWNPSIKYISTTKSHLALFIESIIMFPVFQPIFAFQPMKLSALETTDKTGFKILLHFSGEIVGTRPLWKNINDCQLHLMEASFGAREIVCCVVVVQSSVGFPPPGDTINASTALRPESVILPVTKCVLWKASGLSRCLHCWFGEWATPTEVGESGSFQAHRDPGLED